MNFMGISDDIPLFVVATLHSLGGDAYQYYKNENESTSRYNEYIYIRFLLYFYMIGLKIHHFLTVGAIGLDVDTIFQLHVRLFSDIRKVTHDHLYLQRSRRVLIHG